MKKEFGVEVAGGIFALTKNLELGSKQEQMMDSLERIKKQPQEVWMVKLRIESPTFNHHLIVEIWKKYETTSK